MKAILKNFNLFVDGRGHAGSVEEVTPPKLTLKTEEFRPGGYDAPVEVEVGMEKMECSFTLTDYDPEALKLWGVSSGRKTPLTLRKSIKNEADGSEFPAVITMRGLIKEIDPGTLKAGEIAKTKFAVGCDYYKEVVNGQVIHEIDIPNMVRIIDGVDVLAETRRNLGV